MIFCIIMWYDVIKLMKDFIKKNKIYIILAVLLILLFYPKSNGYKNYNDKGGYREEVCECLGYKNGFSFFSQTTYTCFGIPLSCNNFEKSPYQP